jgi:hypothetical protein
VLLDFVISMPLPNICADAKLSETVSTINSLPVAEPRGAASSRLGHFHRPDRQFYFKAVRRMRQKDELRETTQFIIAYLNRN